MPRSWLHVLVTRCVTRGLYAGCCACITQCHATGYTYRLHEVLRDGYTQCNVRIGVLLHVAQPGYTLANWLHACMFCMLWLNHNWMHAPWLFTRCTTLLHAAIWLHIHNWLHTHTVYTCITGYNVIVTHAVTHTSVT